ncbi:MAG: HAMP domain-containing sensor histidine kinase, partial [Candidatus Auribacterota bacterium]|nr:HAMP domain-containing sensor histidine kinase [Candidatus Auribacterota bacterium]
MSLKKIIKRPTTIAFRLGVSYALMFLIFSLGIFTFVYLRVEAQINQQIDNRLREEAREYDYIFSREGCPGINVELEEETEREDTNKMFFRLLTPEGRELGRSDLSSWTDFDFEKVTPSGGKIESAIIQLISTPETEHENVRVLTHPLNPEMLLQIGYSLKESRGFLSIMRGITGLIIFLSLVLAVFGGWLMARRALSGVEKVTRTARNISETSLDHRVSIRGTGDEFDRLATTFNDMLDRIQELIRGMKEINDNIAHDLRSPITRIRGLAETTLSGEDSIKEYQDMAASTVEECDRLLAMINTMLDLAEMDAGVAEQKIVEFDVSQMVQDACELFRPVAEDKQVTINSKAPPVIKFWGDIKELQRALANLIDNALKYTGEGGVVTVTVKMDKRDIRISISDTGIGISANELSCIFERFHRGDKSRTETGIGLGLSLARAFVQANGGEITVTSSPGQGSTFTIILPRA